MRISDWSSDVCSSDLSLSRTGRASFFRPLCWFCCLFSCASVNRRNRSLSRRRIRIPANDSSIFFLMFNDVRRLVPHRLRAPKPPLPCYGDRQRRKRRSEEHTSELQSLMRTSYAVFCLKKKTNTDKIETQQK